MGTTIQADEDGTLVVPPGVVKPGASFIVEPCGDVVILRRVPSGADKWWATTTPGERVAWLKQWIESLPPGRALPREATRRDARYD